MPSKSIQAARALNEADSLLVWLVVVFLALRVRLTVLRSFTRSGRTSSIRRISAHEVCLCCWCCCLLLVSSSLPMPVVRESFSQERMDRKEASCFFQPCSTLACLTKSKPYCLCRCVCAEGTFDEAGVVNLNRRAESVMTRLGVPMVHGYDITRKQAWATLPADGR